ncbi:MAG: ribonuclease H-like domain-containing protein [Candidatus Kapabacteria bacterium]|nr:ribonuclease H-like domain-containing protein [Candidatus Kapabacteria bacterium]
MAKQTAKKKTKATTKKKVDKPTAKKAVKKTAPKTVKAKSTKKATPKPTVKSKKEVIDEPIITRPIFNSDRFMDFFGGGQLLERNQKKFKGVTIDKHYKGKVLENEHGECYHISDITKIDIIKPNHDRLKEKLVSDLKVLAGIADITEGNLRREGICRISQLTKHYRYGNDAINFINHVESRNAVKIYEQLSSRFTSSNPLLLANSAFFNLSDIAFLDIETLGLSEVPLFLIGIATFKDNQLITEQIFVRELKEEKAALHFLGQLLQGKQAIGTFNGKSFDVPFIRKRMERHDLKHEIKLPHFDLKYFSQKAFSNLVFDFRLSTLERELFKVERVDDVPGFQIPRYYSTYIKTKNIGSVVPIIDHNKQDLISTAKLFMKLHEIWG